MIISLFNVNFTLVNIYLILCDVAFFIAYSYIALSKSIRVEEEES